MHRTRGSSLRGSTCFRCSFAAATSSSAAYARNCASAEHPNPVTGAPRQTLLGLHLSRLRLKGHYCGIACTGFHHTRLSVTAPPAYSTFSTPFDLYGTKCTRMRNSQIFDSERIIPIRSADVKERATRTKQRGRGPREARSGPTPNAQRPTPYAQRLLNQRAGHC
jgi:hypothetical protein